MRTSYTKLQLQKRTQLSIPFHSLHIETKLPPPPKKKRLATSKDEIHWPSKSLGTILEAHSAPPNRPSTPNNNQTNHHHPLRENFFPAGPSQTFFWGASDIKKSEIIFFLQLLISGGGQFLFWNCWNVRFFLEVFQKRIHRQKIW